MSLDARMSVALDFTPAKAVDGFKHQVQRI
jgi:hypothetical protein